MEEKPIFMELLEQGGKKKKVEKVPFDVIIEILEKNKKERTKEEITVLANYFGGVKFFQGLAAENGEEALLSLYKAMSIKHFKER
jgi:hypothetical protein